MSIRIKNLSVQFGPTKALDDISIEIDEPEMIGIIGRSGAGKSTMLRCINRLVEPSSGSILFEGRDVLALSGYALRRWRASAAMIFQQFNLSGRLDVLTNVMVGASAEMPQLRRLFRIYTSDERLRAATILDDLGMLERALERAERLSGGQQQRVAIARALMQAPRLMLADEPVASLDPLSSKAVMDALAQCNKTHRIPVLCNLHDVALARQYMTRVIGLRAGRLVFDGPVSALNDAALSEIYGGRMPVSEPVSKAHPHIVPVPA